MAHQEKCKKMELDKEGSGNRNWSNLPPELISKILSFLCLEDIAECREVCQSFNESGKMLLNKEAKRILDVLQNYVSNVEFRVPPGPPQVVNSRRGPLSKKYLLLKNLILCFEKLYDSYIENNTSCFVGGTIMDLVNSMMVSIARLHSGQQFKLHELEFNLEVETDELELMPFVENIRRILDRRVDIAKEKTKKDELIKS